MSRSAGHLHDHGHGLDHGQHGRGAGHRPADQCRHPAVDSRRCVLAHMAGRRIVEMVREDLTHVADPDPRGLRERHPRQRRHRRLDQCGGASAGARRPDRRRARPGRLGPPRPRRADHRRPDAVRPLPDGGFLLRRRPAGGAEEPGRGRPAASRRHDRQRADDLARTSPRRRELQPRGDPPARQAADREGGIAVLRGNLAPERRRAQALGGDPCADAASRPGRGLREHRALPRAHRRPGARDRRDLASWC